MRKQGDKIYLQDIAESIQLVLDYIGDKTEFDYAKDTLLQDAVNRRFEIIGEASTKVSDTFKAANPQIEWRLMKAMRNKLIHEYFGVSGETVYRTCKKDLPVLKEKIDAILVHFKF